MIGDIKAHRGGNLRNGKTTFPHVARRQEEAKVRQDKYSSLSTQRKIQLHLSRVGTNADGSPKGGHREFNRLMAKLTAENLAVVEKAQAKAKKNDK